MADFSELKAAIRQDIKDNTEQEITGDVLQGDLLRMVDDINAAKVDKEPGKGLSTNDYTDEDKAKLNNLPTNAVLEEELASKQGILTFDEVPTENSNNPVKSGGVYDAVNPNVGTSIPSGGFLPNVVYELGLVSGTVTFDLATGVIGKVNHYFWTFTAHSPAPTITWPNNIIWAGGSAPTITAGKHYEVSILENVALVVNI